MFQDSYRFNIYILMFSNEIRPYKRVGTVHAQHKFRLDGQQREYHAGDNVEVKNILGEESLKPSDVGVSFYGCRHRIGKFVETDRLHHSQSVEEQHHELYACQIHTLSKMLLQSGGFG